VYFLITYWLFEFVFTDTRRSASGFIFMLAGAHIYWQSRAQATVALSSTEAEHVALAAAALVTSGVT